MSIQSSLPSLQELHLCSNNISKLSAPEPEGGAFPQLQVGCTCTVNKPRQALWTDTRALQSQRSSLYHTEYKC